MGGESEVISHGSDRDPWRPSRRLVAIAVGAAVLAVASVLVTRQVQERRHERAAEAQAVRLAAFDVEELSPGGEMGWRLSNLTGTRFTVASLVLDFPHQDLLTQPQELLPHGSLAVRMSPVACEEGLYDRGPRPWPWMQ